MPPSDETSISPAVQAFATTHWSVVVEAGKGTSAASADDIDAELRYLVSVLRT